MKRALALVLLAASVAACTRYAEAPTRPAGPASPAALPPPNVAAAEGPPVRTCESHVVGDIAGWRRYSTVIGPVGFLGLPSYAEAGHRPFASKGERYRVLKTLLVIERGPAVTVTILDGDRARLLYDPAGWRNRNLYPLEGGTASMVFEPCDFVRRTQFNGTILVTGRTCVTIEVAVRDQEPERAEVPIGLPSCSEG